MLDQLEPVWPAHLRRFEDLFALHYVSSPPAFLNSPPVTTYLLQFINDRFDQVHEDDILALVSIVMESPERKQRLKVLWAPDSIRVQVRSQRYTWCDIAYSERNSRARRIFMSSDKDAGGDDTSQLAGSSGTPARSRSRKRLHSEASSDSYAQLPSSRNHLCA